MGEGGRVVNVDRRQELGLQDRMDAILGGSASRELSQVLRVPSLRALEFSAAEIASARSRSTPTPLLDLPDEILRGICVEHVEFDDVFSMALTCSYIFRILGPRLRATLQDYEAPWANCRLVLAGGFSPSLASSLGFLEKELEGLGTYPNALYHRAKSWESQSMPTPLFTKLDYNDNRLLRQLARKRGTGWGVLRCLDRKQYVREDVAVQVAYNLGHVLCIMILCESEWGVQGAWAGCRIDINSVDQVGEDWEDLSSEVAHWFRMRPQFGRFL